MDAGERAEDGDWREGVEADGGADDGEGAEGGGVVGAGEETGSCWSEGDGRSGEEGEETAEGVLMSTEGVNNAGGAEEGCRTRYRVRAKMNLQGLEGKVP